MTARPEARRVAGRWIAKADEDLAAAERLVSLDDSLAAVVCFHCQQSAEKYLKAVLVELGRNVPRTHNLEDLLVLLLPDYPHLSTLRRGLKFLIQFAVEARYPGFRATKPQASCRRTTLGQPRR